MEMQTTTKLSVKTGYEFLTEMTAIETDFNAFTPRINPITNRVEYIRYQLTKMNVPFELDYFNADNPETLHIDKNKYVNVYAFFKGENSANETIVFLAHHDIVNLNSENCQDNTASVCNLLHLCNILKGEKLNRNVLVVFTDAEEIVSYKTCGAKRLAILSNLGMFGKVIKAINLELTAIGECLWVSSVKSNILMNEMQIKYNAEIVKTPYNDAFVLEDNGMNSVCIGTLTNRDLDIALLYNFCNTWSLCHKDFDTIEGANAEDMKRFVENVLLKIALA